MLTRFEAYIKEKGLCNKDDEILLAVSGGIDSVVMTDLFINAGYSCSILHCNFKLREAESDGDEAFVRSLSAIYDIPVYVKHFETEDYASENGLSIQMAAREMRYKWFDEMGGKSNANYIATAHNMNDSVETLLLNLTRGTGIKGLNGIPGKNGTYIRPLLFAKRTEIQEYCHLHKLNYREDSSNASKKYSRNKVRHDLIPLFEEINPSFLDTMNENINRFGEAYELYSKEILRVKNEIFIDKSSHKEIDLLKLRKLYPLSTWLYELFSEYGFSINQCLNIEKIIDSDSGKQFISPTYRLFKDREKLLLYETEYKSFERYYIDSPESKATLPFSMDMEVLNQEQLSEFPDSSNIAVLDLYKLSFPLTIRKWQHGDYFYPLGMDQLKKLSDFFIDNKLPVPEKNRTWILCSGKDIVWIMGQRIDNRFKITDKTSRILKFHLY
jgi:tRNA(Ile)-lysidine synthase